MAGPKRRFWRVLIGLLIAANVVLLVSGRGYFYKALLYNYVNIDDLDLFHTREVQAGIGEPWHIGSDYNKNPLSDTLSKTLEAYRSVAFLVIKDDSIRHEQYWDDYGKGSRSNSFSVAKSIVGTLTGIALGEGKIKSLDDPVCNYLDWFCDDNKNNITIRHLLTMSSGIDWNEGYTSLTSPVTRLYYDTHLEEQMQSLRIAQSPGEEFNYMSCNTQLLAFVIRKATGKNISEYASEKLWKPIGAEHSAFWSLDGKDGNEKAYCCFYSNARDFARFGKLFLQGGKWGDRQVVPESYVRESITPAAILDNGKPNRIYGYQWWMTTVNDQQVFYARGILGQYIFVIPTQRIIFVRLGHVRAEKGTDGELLDVPVYLSEVLKMYGDQPAPVVTAPDKIHNQLQ
jgi:CubicO group peptidase (beta-lactamase class C family)